MPPLPTTYPYKVPGGMTSLRDDTPTKGVYANYPAGSPRYHTGNGMDSIGRQARMFIKLGSKEAYDAWCKNLGRTGAGEYAKVIGLVDAAGDKGGGYGYVDFLAQSLSFGHQERYQTHVTLADAYALYLFGQDPVQLQLSGTLLNTKQDPWYDAWQHVWANIIRGTLMARGNRSLSLRVGNRVYVGTPLSESTSLNAQMETAVSFSMTMMVRKIIISEAPHTMRKPTDLNELARFSTDPATFLNSDNLATIMADIASASWDPGRSRVAAADVDANVLTFTEDETAGDFDPTPSGVETTSGYDFSLE